MKEVSKSINKIQIKSKTYSMLVLPVLYSQSPEAIIASCLQILRNEKQSKR